VETKEFLGAESAPAKLMRRRYERRVIVERRRLADVFVWAVDVERYMSVNFTGVWNANLRRSTFLGAPPKAMSVKIDQSDPELQAEIVVTKLDGNEERVVFKCWINGQDRHLLNGRPVRGGARWEGEELIIESWMQFGARETHFCDCWSLSFDGQTLIMEHRNDDLAGQLSILDRAE
jgi:hypothetical protein